MSHHHLSVCRKQCQLLLPFVEWLSSLQSHSVLEVEGDGVVGAEAVSFVERLSSFAVSQCIGTRGRWCYGS